MCIICNCGEEIGCGVLQNLSFANARLRECEKLLLKYYDDTGNTSYDKLHKLIVRKRRSLGEIEKVMGEINTEFAETNKG